ncbi:DUF3842 family protein [Acidaminobacter sp. JC074]|uniref:DUF3842 family protein n=1 Tax=Acidaminobacter sp. JC074 TaxID=2530199 RepID=UPI001F0DE45F|nr:DUF3842 family protein [Acidaminobacter sp. JC074]MCH4888077.1 DUF3842 family protein [Acidaminobacter sp. JC074]
MQILVLDGQGGGLGRQIVTAIKSSVSDASVIAVGTNSMATNAMLKAGADFAATGENAVIVNARKVDIIIGPIGMVIADSLYGEITPAMAVAIGQSHAKRIIIPMNHCDNIVAGVTESSVGDLVNLAIEQVKKYN